jgi:hypothetical protein
MSAFGKLRGAIAVWELRGAIAVWELRECDRCLGVKGVRSLFGS